MKFFSKMLDTKNLLAFQKYGISPQCFITAEEIETYKVLEKYIKKNHTTPSPEELSLQIEGFLYVPNVYSSFDSLAEDIKAQYAKHEIMRVIQGQVIPNDPHKKYETIESLINKKEGNETLDWLIDQLTEIKTKTAVHEKKGLSLTEDYDWFFDEYEDRKSGKSSKIWKSKFPTINKILGGGYLGGNMYTWYARSGRGKSIFCLKEALEAAYQGATVLYWGLEMTFFELYCRAYTSFSARLELFHTSIDGVNYEVGFPAKDILMSKLPDDYLEALRAFADDLNQTLPGKIIFRAVDDKNFDIKTCKQLETEIDHLHSDVVVIDPVYYMQMEKNSTGTKGGGLAETSKRLKHIAGKTSTVIHMITQSEEVKNQYEGNERILRPPTRDEMKKSKQLLEDASLTFGIDTLDGKGVVLMGKGRFGGEDKSFETIFLPNYGVVRELPTMEEAQEQFKDADISVF